MFARICAVRFLDPQKHMGGGAESLKSLDLARLESCQKCTQRAQYVRIRTTSICSKYTHTLEPQDGGCCSVPYARNA